MNKRRLIMASVAHHWRTHLSVIAGAAVGAAVLVGALIVGDSVRHTLREQALARIGQVDLALTANDRLFPISLADRLEESIDQSRIAPLLMLRGIVSTTDGDYLARQVNLLGVEPRFFDLAPTSIDLASLADNTVFINERLARQLHVSAGDEIVVRVEKPSAMPRGSALGTVEDMSLALRVSVVDIVEDDEFGRFSLQADQIPPFNLFVSIDWLASQLDVSDRANAMLLASPEAGSKLEAINDAIQTVFELGDAQLAITSPPIPDEAELRSDRIFIDPVIEETLISVDVLLEGILTYFVNALEYDGRSTPYSIVSAIGPLQPDRPLSTGAFLPADLANDEIMINQWLADDLQASPGDSIRVRYFIIDDDDRLVERSTDFTCRSITPLEGPAADRTLMPEFPGIADAESSRDWEPGIPIDLGLIRDQDEAYWETHRGTPKAFVNLAAGKTMWGNRYGALTAVRFEDEHSSAIQDTLRRDLDPASFGLLFRDVRTPALLASKSTTDFGGLFLALSFFLIFAALLLTALLFVFNIEQRRQEIGTLLAIGFQPKLVRRLLLGEGAMLAFIGSVIGTAGAVGYTKVILTALAGIWSEAIASASIVLHVTPLTLVIGAAASILAACFAMRLTLRRAVRQEPVALLTGGASLNVASSTSTRAPTLSVVLALTAILAALVIVLTVGTDSRSASMAFFSAGSLLLVGGVILSRTLFVRLRRHSERFTTSLRSLAIRNSARRVGRSLSTVTLLAGGVFLVVAVAANRLDATRDAELPSSGTGGFALIGESTMPVLYDLNEQRGRDAFGLSDEELQDVSFVSMRVRDGDDASCLNLNLVQNPRLMGVDPAQLDAREAFSFARFASEAGADPGWLSLDEDLTEGIIPAFADDKSVTWAMHKSVGDTIDYTDEQGRPFKVMIVGTIANSILQGNLLISERRFRDRFPSEEGFRSFLIDAPLPESEDLSRRLQRAMTDVGLELTSTSDRLDDFNAIQNTYLAIFQILGGLGLLLGSIGLGIVVFRNVLERRKELALLRAVGFNLKAIRRFVIHEHIFILLLGLVVGTIAALVAVLPALRSATAEFPVQFTLLLLGLLVANGLIWVWLATHWAVSGPLADSLREE